LICQRLIVLIEIVKQNHDGNNNVIKTKHRRSSKNKEILDIQGNKKTCIKEIQKPFKEVQMQYSPSGVGAIRMKLRKKSGLDKIKRTNKNKQPK